GWWGGSGVGAVAPAGVDIPDLADIQGACGVWVHGPGVLEAGGAFVAPHAADHLCGGLDDPPCSGQFADRLGVGGPEQPDPAIGGGGGPGPPPPPRGLPRLGRGGPGKRGQGFVFWLLWVRPAAPASRGGGPL